MTYISIPRDDAWHMCSEEGGRGGKWVRGGQGGPHLYQMCELWELFSRYEVVNTRATLNKVLLSHTHGRHAQVVRAPRRRRPESISGRVSTIIDAQQSTGDVFRDVNTAASAQWRRHVVSLAWGCYVAQPNASPLQQPYMSEARGRKEKTEKHLMNLLI